MPTTQSDQGQTPQGGAGGTAGGASRTMAELSVDELLAMPPSPVRSPLFANRFPVPVEEFEQLKVEARTHDLVPLEAGAGPDAQQDEEAPAALAELNPPEDDTAGVGGAARAPSTTANFEGISQTAFRPPDCTLAAGPTRVMAAVNVDLVGYDKLGTQQFRWANFTALFKPGAAERRADV